MLKIALYHGSKDVIEKPIYGFGNPKNDYGLGFYITKDIELAKEWACSEDRIGKVNKYVLDLSKLNVLDLSSDTYNVLNWIAILLENRIVDLQLSPQKAIRDFIISNYLPNYKDYDVIYGYRADDSYFMMARAFINNQISLEQLSSALRFGKLGFQYCIKSKKAFENLKFVDAQDVDNEIYYLKIKERDNKAKLEYLNLTNNSDLNGKYIIDIIKEANKNEK